MASPAVRQFAGDIRFWEIDGSGNKVPVIADAGDAQGNQPLEVGSLTFSYEAGDEQNVVSKRRDARYGQPIHSATDPGATSVSVTSLEVPPLILARMLYGTGTSGVVNAGTVSAVDFTLPDDLTIPVQLPHRMLDSGAGITITESGSPVSGATFTVDWRRGQVYFHGAHGLTGGDTVKLTYEYTKHVSTAIVGGAAPTKPFYITGDMEDRVSGENGELRIPQANLTTDGDVDWLSSEPITVTLTGKCVVASGEAAAYTFTIYKTVA